MHTCVPRNSRVVLGPGAQRTLCVSERRGIPTFHRRSDVVGPIIRTKNADCDAHDTMHHNALYEEPKQRVPEVLVSPRSCLSRHPVIELLLLVLVLVVLRDCRPRSCGRSARAPPLEVRWRRRRLWLWLRRHAGDAQAMTVLYAIVVTRYFCSSRLSGRMNRLSIRCVTPVRSHHESWNILWVCGDARRPFAVYPYSELVFLDY